MSIELEKHSKFKVDGKDIRHLMEGSKERMQLYGCHFCRGLILYNRNRVVF